MNPESLSLLSQLRDIHQPDTGGFAIAPVWFVLALMLVIALLLLRSLIARFFHQRAAERWRSDARQELSSIRGRQQQQDLSVTVAECSGLLRRIALAVKPRSEVAALTGHQWLQVLDQMHGSNTFSESYASLLLEFTYRKPRAGTHSANTTPEAADVAIQSGQQSTEAQRVLDLLGVTGELIERAAPSVSKPLDGTAS